LTLEEEAVKAINFTGNATVNLGCGIATNSTAPMAIDAGGSSSLIADPIMARGGLDATNPYYGSSTILPYSDKQEDPFADRVDPSGPTASMVCGDTFNQNAMAPVKMNEANGTAVCYSQMFIDRAITLPAGTYYIRGGNIVLGPLARVTGTGVTFVFTGTGDNIGKLEMSGQASLTLTAPTTGPYKDIVIFRDKDRLTMDDMQFNGGNALNLTGAIYMPKTNIIINGGTTMSSSCLQIVSQRISFSGNLNLANNCSTNPDSNFKLRQVRLVG
jgi:hypothetical protein